MGYELFLKMSHNCCSHPFVGNIFVDNMQKYQVVSYMRGTPLFPSTCWFKVMIASLDARQRITLCVFVQSLLDAFLLPNSFSESSLQESAALTQLYPCSLVYHHHHFVYNFSCFTVIKCRSTCKTKLVSHITPSTTKSTVQEL